MEKFKKLIPLATGAAALSMPSMAFAQELVPTKISPINNIVTIIRAAISFILVVAFVAAFIFLLLGGLRWITAGGDEKAVASARNMITAALIGLVIVLLAYAIIRLVEIFFGVNIITGGITLPNVQNPQ